MYQTTGVRFPGGVLGDVLSITVLGLSVRTKWIPGLRDLVPPSEYGTK